jgi:hypothetical protein
MNGSIEGQYSCEQGLAIEVFAENSPLGFCSGN